MDRIDECITTYREWCKKLGIVTVGDINRLIGEGKTRWLVNVSEIWHEQNISEIADKIRDSIDKKKIILISGPSSSGKTTFATRLQLHLRVLGIKSVSISLDNYYIKRSSMPKNKDGKPDFETLESIDCKLFNQNLSDLISGEEAFLPEYDFKTATPVPDAKRMRLDKDEVVIVEGIHGLNPKLTESIPGDEKYKIYCSALTALKKDDGSKIRSRTTRLMRRLIRDYYFRNASYSFTYELWPDVEAGAEENIYPYTDTADIIFNSSLLYEFAVYHSHLLEVFKKAPANDPNRDSINELLSIVDSINDIDEALVPGMSFIREFVGGSTLYNQ